MKITIEIEIKPLNVCNLTELSSANKTAAKLVNEITEVLKNEDLSQVFFDFKIDTYK